MAWEVEMQRQLRPETMQRQALDRLKRRVMDCYRQACAYEGVDDSQAFHEPFTGEFSPHNPHVAAYQDALAQWKAQERP
jgi:hypothetical protein